MRVTQLLLTGAVALILSACANDVTTAPPEAPQLSMGNGTARVRGEVSTPSGSGLRVVTVDAQQNPAGMVKGSYRIELTAPGVFFDVAVTCVVSEGNTAWVAGIISETNTPAIQVGTVSYFYASDVSKPNEGGPPDVISTARINDVPGEDMRFCAERPIQLPQLAGVEGDLRVW